MNKLIRDILIVAVVAISTLITRALPFLVFPENKKSPPYNYISEQNFAMCSYGYVSSILS